MRIHKFHSGQVMNVVGGAMQPIRSGRYEIVRTMPERDSEPQYRVKSLADGSEWVIKESSLG